VKAALAILAFASPFALHLAIVSENRAVMVVFLAMLTVGALAARVPAWVAALAAVAAIASAWIDLRLIAQLALAGPVLAFLAGCQTTPPADADRSRVTASMLNWIATYNNCDNPSQLAALYDGDPRAGISL